jgi:uncharacterized protein YggE
VTSDRGGATGPAPTVVVTGTGRAARAADVARATFAVEVTRDTATGARADAATVATAVLTALNRAGLAPDDIGTAGIDVSPSWDHDGTRSVRTGFTVTNRIAVTIRDLERVGEVLDAGLEAGATGLDGVRFELADPSAATTEARRAAVADARGRADTIADATGAVVGSLVGIVEGGSVPSPRHEARMAAFAGDTLTVTPVVPGTVEVTVSVTAEWELEA